MTDDADWELVQLKFADRNLQFPQHPRIISDLSFFSMPDGLGLQIRGLERNLVLRGNLDSIEWLLAEADGKRSIKDLVLSRPQNLAADDLADCLLLLFRKGIICDSSATELGTEKISNETSRRESLFWGRQVGVTRSNNDGSQVKQRIQQCKLLLLGNGLLGASTYDLLSRSGFSQITIINWGEDPFVSDAISKMPVAPLAVMSTARSLGETQQALSECLPAHDIFVSALRHCPSAVFESINQLCITNQIRWICGHDNSSAIDIGPTVEPFSSGCYLCMQLRQTSANDLAIEDALYEEHNATLSRPEIIGESISTATLAASILCQETIRTATMIYPPAFEDAVLNISPTGVFTLNKFRRVPRCPACYRGGQSNFVERKESGTSNQA